MEDSSYVVPVGITGLSFYHLSTLPPAGTACFAYPHCRDAACFAYPQDCFAYLIINFAFYMVLSPPFHSGTAARRDGVCDGLKFKYEVKQRMSTCVRHGAGMRKDGNKYDQR